MVRWDGDAESNESMYERFIMGVTAKVVDREVVEWVRRVGLSWFGNATRINEDNVVERV